MGGKFFGNLEQYWGTKGMRFFERPANNGNEVIQLHLALPVRSEAWSI